jgi:hypothetical protein
MKAQLELRAIFSVIAGLFQFISEIYPSLSLTYQNRVLNTITIERTV